MYTTETKSVKNTVKATNVLTKNVIQFKKGFINLTQVSKDSKNYSLAMTVVAELMQFGFILDKSAIDNLSNASKEDIISFHNEVVTYLKEVTGSNRTYKAFWGGFPQQIMEKSECELWLHQIVHYMSNGAYVPNEFTQERPTAFEQPSYTKIISGDNERFLNIFTSLVGVNQSLTPDDLDIIKYFVNEVSELRFSESVPFKENLSTIFSELISINRTDVKFPKLTVTDVLRIVVGLSGGDVSLPKVPNKMVKQSPWSNYKIVNTNRDLFKFAKFSRSERKFILNLLEQTNCDATEAVLKDQRWVRLGEILHPFEHKNKFPKAAKMFHEIRNTKVVSWYGKLNKAFNTSLNDGLNVLSERAGEFARKLDFLVRTYPNDVKLILDKFNLISLKVSNKVLYETYTHFAKRATPTTNRSVMVKGARKRTVLPQLPALSPSVIELIQKQVIKSLAAKYAKLPELGSVWIDEELKKIPLPTNMRSMSSGLKPIVRGQRMPIGNSNTKVIRAFCHWFDERGDQDIDLTCTFLGMGKVELVGWNGGHNTKIGVYSGDIRHRQGSCAEYIDINIKNALERGFKYVIMDARNFNGGSFESVKDCVVGYMEREFPKANEIFVPATIANCMRLTNEASTTLVSVIDLETLEVIHLDLDKDGIPVASADINGLLEAIKPYCELPKFSVYDLLSLHARNRGSIVDMKENADKVFNFGDFSESYVGVLEYMGV